MNKSRRFLFLALGLIPGVAKSQPFAQKSGGACWNTAPPCSTVNNRCPLCGTLAEPFKRPIGVRQIRRTETEVAECSEKNRRSTGDTVLYCGVYFEDGPVGPMDRVTRCKRCNTAFFQDAVE